MKYSAVGQRLSNVELTLLAANFWLTDNIQFPEPMAMGDAERMPMAKKCVYAQRRAPIDYRDAKIIAHISQHMSHVIS